MKNRKNLDLEKLDSDFFTSNITIEASAGTGKTYTIQQLVKQIIESDGENLVDKKQVKLSEILLVTFTNKAAGELRSRIREILEESSQKENTDLAKKERIERALRSIDQAPIYTFHSFCEMVLGQYGFEANVNTNTSLIDPSQIKSLVEYICRDEWPKDKKFLKLLERGVSVESLIVRTVDLAQKYNPEIKTFVDQYDLEKLKENIESTDYKALITSYSERAKELHPDWKIKWKINPNAKENEKVVQSYGAVSIKNDRAKYTDKESQDIISFFESYNGQTPNSIRELAQKAYETAEVNSFIQEQAINAYDKWQAYKTANYFHTYDDLIEAVYKACAQDSSLLKELRRRYRYGIIDEFQDTNIFQWGIFKNIFLEGKANRIFVVGDPKQAIYKFQGADIAVYQKACSDILGKTNGKGFRLANNFRSSKAIIDACNDLCGYKKEEKEEKAFLFDANSDNNQGKVEFVESGFGKKDDTYKPMLNGKEVPALWISPDNISDYKYASFAINQVKDMIGKVEIPRKDPSQSKKLTYSDIAILTRSHKEMKAFEHHLRKSQIPFILYKEEGLFKSVECRYWSILLKAIATRDNSPKSQSIKRSSLITPFFNKSLNDAHNFNFDDRSDIFAQNISAWQKLAEDRKWISLIQKIFENTTIEKDLLEIGKFQELAKYHQIGEYIQECLCKNNWSLEKMTLHLDKLCTGKESPIIKDAQYISRETDKNVVQVMTLHQSKGLEFPVVIVVGGKSSGKNEQPFVYSLDDSNSAIPKRAISLTNGKNICQKEDDDEIRRMYYVAVTRAKFIMFLPRYTAKKKLPLGASDLFIKPAINAVFNKIGKDALTADAAVAYTSANIQTDSFETWNKLLKTTPVEISNEINDNEETRSIRDLHKHLNAIKTNGKTNLFCEATSYTKLTHSNKEEGYGKNDESDATDGNETGNQKIGASFNDSNYPRGAVFGVAIHEVFELLDFNEGKQVSTSCDSPEATELYNRKRNEIESIFHRNGVQCNEQIAKDTIHIIHETMNAALPKLWSSSGETFCLGDINESDKKTEMQFNIGAVKKVLNESGQMQINLATKEIPTWFFNGFIDLLFRVDGRYCILDWKGNYIGNYSVEGIEENMERQKYTVQRALYSIILIEWLASIKHVTSEIDKEKIYNELFGGVYYCYLRGTHSGTSMGFSNIRYESYTALVKEFKALVETRLLA